MVPVYFAPAVGLALLPSPVRSREKCTQHEQSCIHRLRAPNPDQITPLHISIYRQTDNERHATLQQYQNNGKNGRVLPPSFSNIRILQSNSIQQRSFLNCRRQHKKDAAIFLFAVTLTCSNMPHFPWPIEIARSEKPRSVDAWRLWFVAES